MSSNVRVMKGNILESNAHTLVNTVNCVGIMGKGIALQFKEKFPAMFKDYQERCEKNEVKLGKPYIYRSTVPPWILNFPTKDHWRSVSNLEDIKKGLDFLLLKYKEWDIKSIAVPPLGCGHGQLDWTIIGPTLYRYLNAMSIPVELYAPFETPKVQMQEDFLSSGYPQKRENSIDPSWVALIAILKCILSEPYHWPIGRVVFQKIAYVATRRGINTNLQFTKNSYGPYSADLKSVVSKLINNGLLIEERRGNRFIMNVGPTYQDAKSQYLEELRHYKETILEISDLFLRISTTNEAELATTAMFVNDEMLESKEYTPTEMDIFKEVLDWKKRRIPKVDTQELALIIRELAIMKWLSVEPSPDLPVPNIFA